MNKSRCDMFRINSTFHIYCANCYCTNYIASHSKEIRTDIQVDLSFLNKQIEYPTKTFQLHKKQYSFVEESSVTSIVQMFLLRKYIAFRSKEMWTDIQVDLSYHNRLRLKAQKCASIPHEKVLTWAAHEYVLQTMA